jgi:DNA sulfur modification protein DndC
VCQQAEDRSLQNMLEYDDRYSYARGLNKLNKFIRNTRYDMSRRHWIGRTIKANWICIAPDTYHPTMVRELFRYMVQVQHDERVRARRAGERPRFEIFSDKMVLTLDAYWSLTGLATPFSAWADVDAITNDRVRYDIPDIEPFPVCDVPDARFIHVGNEWEEQVSMSQNAGLRDAYVESLLEGSACAPNLKTIKSTGRVIWDVGSSGAFEVDDESVAMIMDFEMDRLLEMQRQYSKDWMPGSITFGYKWYLAYGALKLSPGQAAIHDKLLRRTAFKDSIGMTCNYDIEALRARSTRFADLPDDARRAWTKKASMDSAQTAFEMDY